jgi:hypothetical protein
MRPAQCAAWHAPPIAAFIGSQLSSGSHGCAGHARRPGAHRENVRQQQEVRALWPAHPCRTPED